MITDKGFGFIAVEGEDKELFFHSKELKGVTFEELKKATMSPLIKLIPQKVQMPQNVTRV